MCLSISLYSDTAPASPSVGDMWWDSVAALKYIWYQDPTSTQWVNTNNAAGGGGGFIAFNSYSSSQTISIPVGATKALVELWGGTGGSGAANGSTAANTAAASGGSGAAGFLRKYLTGLAAGLNLIYTQGAAGAGGTTPANNGGNGGASSLASGTQTITTLTANGSTGSLGQSLYYGLGTAGGTAVNGDLNLTGQAGGMATYDTNDMVIIGGDGGSTAYSFGARGVTITGNASQAGNAGQTGGCQIWWYA